MVTKGDWKAKMNALGTWTIYTNLEHIGQIDSHFNGDLIVTAVNMCKSINPDNPQAVAESIELAFEKLDEMARELCSNCKEMTELAEGEGLMTYPCKEDCKIIQETKLLFAKANEKGGNDER